MKMLSKMLLPSGMLAGGFSLLFVPAAKAQDVEESETRKEVVAQMETITVTGRTDDGLPLDAETETGSRLGLSLRETPATIDVLTQEQLQALGARNTQEALNRVSGVTSNSSPTAPGSVILRGFSGNAVNQLYDGVRPAASGFQSRILDSWAFERIEVLKGPSSILYGEGSLGGAVNLVPKRPRLGVSENLAQFGYGEFNTLRVAGDTNAPVGERAAARLVASYGHSDGYVDDTESEYLAASLSGLWRPTDRLTLNLALDYSEDDYDTAYYGTPLVPREFARNPSDIIRTADGRVLDKAMRDVNFALGDGIVDSDTTWIRSGAKYQLAGLWTLSNSFDVYQSDRRFIDAENFNFNRMTSLVDRSADITTHDFEFFVDRLVLNGETKIAGFRNRLAVGGEYSDVNFLSDRGRGGKSTSVDPFNPDRGLFPATGGDPAAFTSRTQVDSTIKTTGLFLEDAINLTERLSLVGGLRHDRIEVTSVINDLKANTLTPIETNFDKTTGRIGTVFDLLPKTQLFAQYSTATSPPGSLLLLSVANAAFDLTTGDASEVGVKSSLLNDRIEMTFALFDIQQKDIITRDAVDPTISVQGGRQSSRGAEVSLSVAVTPRLTLDANYTALNAEFDELIEAGGVDRKGKTPSGIPEKIGNLFAYYKLDPVPVTLSGGLHYSGRHFFNNANDIRVDGYTTVEAAVNYRLAFAEISLRGRNLTDEFYANIGSFGSQILIAAPRSVDLSVTARF